MAEKAGDRPSLERLLRARHRCISIATVEEGHALSIVRDAGAALGLPIWVWSATGGVCDGRSEGTQVIEDSENPAAGLHGMARLAETPSLFVTLDLADHFADPRVVRACRDLVQAVDRRGGHVVLIDHAGRLPASIEAVATPFEVPLPDERELERILRTTLRSIHREQPIEARISESDLRTIIRNLSGLTRRQAEQIITDTALDDRRFDITDLNRVLAHKRRMLSSSGVLEYVESPVDLSQIGGLRNLKGWLERRRGAFGEGARDFGLVPPRGVLMLGVQGTGKSLCAKAIATAWQRPLVRLDPGSLYDRYIGESEKRLREALKQAEAMAPAVLWIDEIEKGFAAAASTSTDGGVSRRMFGALLTWMQEHTAPVFLVATANDIDALPPELLRKGRFDEIFFVDLPSEEVRRQILDIHLRKRDRDARALGIDLDAVARAAAGFSAAELEQAVLTALHDAYTDGRDVSTDLLLHAIESSPPLSVTAAEKVAALQHWAEGRCVPAD